MRDLASAENPIPSPGSEDQRVRAGAALRRRDLLLLRLQLPKPHKDLDRSRLTPSNEREAAAPPLTERGTSRPPKGQEASATGAARLSTLYSIPPLLCMEIAQTTTQRLFIARSLSGDLPGRRQGSLTVAEALPRSTPRSARPGSPRRPRRRVLEGVALLVDFQLHEASANRYSGHDQCCASSPQPGSRAQPLAAVGLAAGPPPWRMPAPGQDSAEAISAPTV